MDRIRFEATRPIEGGRAGSIRVIVNGRDLVDLLHEHERPLASAEGSPSIAGAYAGLPALKSIEAASLFMGEPIDSLYSQDEKVQLLQCECREPGCWPMLCNIYITDQTVTWTGFEQPHRIGRKGRRGWDYDGFGPFTFDRIEYESAVNALDAEIESISAD